MKEEKILRKVLEENGSKVTKPRLLVFQLLQEHGLQSLAELTARADKKIDRVSIYRTVDLFDHLGIVRRVNIGWKYKVELSEIFLDHHHHITCLHCNKVVAVKENEASEQMIAKLGENTGFRVTSHQIELQGLCEKCQKSHPVPTEL